MLGLNIYDFLASISASTKHGRFQKPLVFQTNWLSLYACIACIYPNKSGS